MTVQEPLFNIAHPSQREVYQSFFQKTEADAIGQFATGSSLTELVDCAEKVKFILNYYNPILDTSDYRWENSTQPDNPDGLVQARQWEIDRLSEVKQRLAQAIVCKRDYYDNHLFGKITKLVLQLFCMWHNGNTASIVTAEDFLLRWDLRYPVKKTGDRYEKVEGFNFHISTEWYRNHLNTENFFNYDPPRQIPLNHDIDHEDAAIAPNFIL